MNHCDTRNHEKIRRMDGAKRNPSSFFLGELFMSFRDFFASSRERLSFYSSHREPMAAYEDQERLCVIGDGTPPHLKVVNA